MEVRAVNKQGSEMGRRNSDTLGDARQWMYHNSGASFVDGYTVEGIGIVRVCRRDDGIPTGRFSRLIDGEFVEGSLLELLPDIAS